MKRLLCILSSMDTGGAETFLMKLYRNIDKSKIQMDFCINDPKTGLYEAEIQSMGGKIYRIPSKSDNLKEFRKQLFAIVKDNGYKYVLRVTSNTMGFMDLKIAKAAGATVCAARSSNSSDGEGIKSKLAHIMGSLLYKKYVDVKIAPSDLAAKYTFGKRVFNKGRVQILHNGLDLDLYKYSPTSNEQIRKELGIKKDAAVIGHIGRFDKQKNHDFLIDIFSAIKQQNQTAVLLMVGVGPLKKDIAEKVAALNLSDSVIFAGQREDIPKLLSAMDLFVFPSFYEGMPNTVLEAQANGLSCVISDSITKDAAVTNLVQYVSLNNTAQFWADLAIKSIQKHQDTSKDFIQAGYDIQSATNKFVKIIGLE